MRRATSRGLIGKGAVATAAIAALSGLANPGGAAAVPKTKQSAVSALTASHHPWAWGFNKYEQLCMDNAVVGSNYRQLTAVQRALPTGVSAVAAGVNHSVFLASGTVSVCGERGADITLTDDTPAAVTFPVGTTISAIAAGDRFSVALAGNRTVWAWGRNSQGQLGNNTTPTASDTPVQVSGLTGVTAIAAGRDHGLALKEDGTVWAWGANADGQLGNGSTTASSVPVQVKLDAGTNLTGVTRIGAGGWHSFAVVGTSAVKAWGLNGNGQLGDATTTSRNYATGVLGLVGTVEQVVGGAYHSLALVTNGSVSAVWAWGAGGAGQLGNGDLAGSVVPLPVASLTGITRLAAGPAASHGLALTLGGRVWAWGNNLYAQLGNGTAMDSPGAGIPGTGPIGVLPSLVLQAAAPAPIPLQGATTIAAGGTFSFAVVP